MPCPEPLHLKKNVLLMRMIGDETPAPRLKDLAWDVEGELDEVLSQVKQVGVNLKC